MKMLTGTSGFKKFPVLGVLLVAVACAAVEGTPVMLEDTNEHLLSGKWVGEYRAVGAITGKEYRETPVTFVIDGEGGTYTVGGYDGSLDWKPDDGKALVNLENGSHALTSRGQIDGSRDERPFTLSRGEGGDLYLQAQWRATVRDLQGKTWPQDHSVVLKKE